MQHDDLDRLLTKEQEIIPSSGFVSSVMNAVRRDATASAPIPFPWHRALPGLCAAGLAVVWLFVEGANMFRGIATQPHPAALLSAFALIFQSWKSVGASWIVLGLILSLASLSLSKRLVSRKV